MKQVVTGTILLVSTSTLLDGAAGRGQLLDGTRTGDMDAFEAMHNNDGREASKQTEPKPPSYIAPPPVRPPLPKQEPEPIMPKAESAQVSKPTIAPTARVGDRAERQAIKLE